MYRIHAWSCRVSLLSRPLLAVALLLACLAPVARSQVLLDHPWETDGVVAAMALSGRTLYLGGGFNYVGPRTGGLVGTDAATGAVIAGFPRISGGSVNATISDGAGGWYIAGDFTTLGAEPRAGLAHIRADLSLDAWAPQAGAIGHLALSGSTLYVGGWFESIDGEPRQCLASFDMTTGALTGWNPGLLHGSDGDGFVGSLAVSGPLVYVGGNFDFCGGAVRNGVAALDATTGVATAWNPNVLGVVFGIVVHGSSVYLGGSYGAVGGLERQGIAEVNAATGLPTAWYPAPQGYVTSLAANGSTLYVGGMFPVIGGQERWGIGAFDMTTGQLTPWNPMVSGYVMSMSFVGARVYLAGNFFEVGGVRREGAAAVDLLSGLVSPWNPMTASGPAAIVPGTAGVLVTGNFNSAGGVHRQNLAAIDAVTGRATDWNPGADQQVRSLAVSESGVSIYVGGDFAFAGGQSRPRLAAIDATTGAATSWQPAVPDAPIWQIVPDGPAVYVSGWFTSLGGAARQSLAALDASTGALLPWNPNPQPAGGVTAMAKQGAMLYVGGQFTSVGGVARGGAASFELLNGSLTAWNPKVMGNVWALAPNGASVLVGGYFGSAGGQTRSNLAAIDAATGLATSWNPPIHGAVRALAIGSEHIYAGGDFDQVAGGPGYLAAFDRATGGVLPWAPLNYSPGTIALVARRDTLYVGGGFTRVDGQPRIGLASFAKAGGGSPLDVTPPVVRVVAPNGGETFTVGLARTIEWVVSDESPVGPGSVYLSRRGPSGPWEFIGTGAVSLVWNVTGPSCGDSAYVRVVVSDASGNEGFDVSDAPFRISGDVTAPLVRVISPNGLEELAVGYPPPIRWTATDSVGVTRVSIYLSRTGAGGPWEIVETDVRRTGQFYWFLTGPECLLSAFVRVDATDAAGNIGSDMSDQGFTIVTPPVPTFTELFRAVPTAQGVLVEWRFADPSSVRDVQLQRAPEVEGEWVRVTQAPRETGTALSVLDEGAPAGETSWYRLSGMHQDGRAFTTAPVAVLAGERITAFALSSPAPNPTAGRAIVTYALPSSGNVRVSLTDVQGREVVLLAEGTREAGRYTAALDASDLRAGLYFIRLQAGEVSLTRRLILVR